MAVVIEADFLRDLAEGGFAVHQNLAGPGQAVADEEAAGRLLENGAEATFELADGEVGDLGQIHHFERFGVMRLDVLEHGVHPPVGLQDVVCAIEVAHAADDANTLAAPVDEGELAGDVPGDGSVCVGHQLHASQDGLAGLHDLCVVLGVVSDHVAGEEIEISLADEFIM